MREEISASGQAHYQHCRREVKGGVYEKNIHINIHFVYFYFNRGVFFEDGR